MPSRALSTARTVTATALTATALGAAALGVHLATDQATASAAGATSSTSGGRLQVEPRPPRQDGSGGFQQVLPPVFGFGGNGGGQSSSHGS
jgi:hypothetical protein